MEKPFITVIITTCGRPFSMLERCLRSVLEQAYSPLEIIIVDDNGTDSPLAEELAEGLRAYPQARLIRHRRNLGTQVSRNDGILHAKGELIAFLDDDDLWLPGKLAAQAAAFAEGVGMVFCQGYLEKTREDGTPVRSPYNMSASFVSEPTFDDLLYGDYIGSTSQAMISREAFARCGLFDTRQPARQDYQMWLHISRDMRCVGVEQYLFVHTLHSGWQITKDPRRCVTGARRIIREFKPELSKRPLAHLHAYVMIAQEWKRDGQLLRYAGNLLRAGLLAPRLVFHLSELRKRHRLHTARVNGDAAGPGRRLPS